MKIVGMFNTCSTDNKTFVEMVQTTINRRYVWEFKGCWKMGRLQDYKMQKVCWVCNNAEECVKVFEELAPKWFRNWKHADDFILQKAY